MEKGAECMCLYPSMFHISCTKLYVKYRDAMLRYFHIPLYPKSIYMIVSNMINVARKNLTIKAHPIYSHCHPPPLSSCLPPLPHAHPPFPVLPLHCKNLEDFVYNPSYSLPTGGFSNNYLSHLFGNPPFILCIWRF